MAKANKIENPNIHGYFLMTIVNDEITVNMAGDDESLTSAFAELLLTKSKKQTEIKRILVDAIGLTAAVLSEKEKDNSKKSNKLQKKPVKTAK